MNQQELIIKPGKNITHFWQELWLYRELFLFLSWRDILVRYKQTAIGVAWSVVRPFLTMIVFSVLFGKVAKMPSNGVPYPILVFAAMLPWQLFSTAFQEGSTSLLNNAGMISKVYFPRIIIPASSIVVSLIDFGISCAIFVGLLLWYRFLPPLTILLLPLFLAFAITTALGASLWISALNVRYRDFKFIVPFVVQFGLYISPVGFSSSIVTPKWRLLYSLNPMVGVIDGFRWCIIGNTNLFLPGLYMSVLLMSVILVSGFWYFRNTERKFADLI